jgi:hypothetical protein
MQVEDAIARKDALYNIHALNQWHPMYLSKEALIETAPPTRLDNDTSAMQVAAM